MTISSSLNAGVMGLTANASRLSTISDNIANSATNGYKRSATTFASLVVNQRSNLYSAGGVRSISYKDVMAQGPLLSTGNSTDIAINGNGMLPVTSFFGTRQDPAQRDFMMVPTGSFTADKNGLLQTQSGLYLLGWPIDVNGEVQTGPRDSTTGLVPVNIDITNLSPSPTRNMSLGLNLPSDAAKAGASGDPFSLPVQYFDNLGSSETLTYTFTPNPGAGNSWSISVEDSATSSVVASFDMTFNDTAGNGGSIATVTPGAGTTYDPATGQISFNVDSGPMQTFIGEIGSSDGITQLAAPFSPKNVTKDGSPIGELQSVEVNEEGIVEAIFNTGTRRSLYQIPVVEVPNPNGLTATNNQAYTISQDSGDLYLWDAGTGPTGDMTGYALIGSNTDIAFELTQLIETQRAYSSNAKIIQTVDEMLQETTNLKR